MNDEHAKSLTVDSSGNSLTSREDVNTRPEAYRRTHERTIVSLVGSRLVTSSSDGREHVYTVAADVEVTCNGVVRETGELRPGTSIRLTSKPNNRNTAVKIEMFKNCVDLDETN